MPLEKVPTSFFSDIICNAKYENIGNEIQCFSKKKHYNNTKWLNISEIGTLKIVKILLRGLSNTVCLCEWVIDNTATSILGNCSNCINIDLLNINKIYKKCEEKSISPFKNNYISKIYNSEVNQVSPEIICDKNKTDNNKFHNVDNIKKETLCKEENTNTDLKYEIIKNINLFINNNDYKKEDNSKIKNKKDRTLDNIGLHKENIIQLVVKIKHKELYSKINDCNKFAEVEIHKKLKHSNILNMILSAEDEKYICVFLEYSSIGDLYSFVGFNILKEREVKIIVSQILFALYYLHIKGIIHCDLKLENLLLFNFDEESLLFESNLLSDINICHTNQFKKLNTQKLMHSINENVKNNPNIKAFKYIVKLCDFGLSVKCEFDKFYPFNGIRGSYGFIAPELFQESSFNNKIDMWALGIISFLLLGGYKPFYPCSRFEEKVIFHERYWHNISPEAKNFIQSLLEIDPFKRINVIEAMDHPWIRNYFIDT
ncbi:calcium/calmodulin-dependent protein kinase, putative [Plasmodium vinckei petteri]|uniref:Calcium/calmodulin-dependent protein kinase, putative n=2 Tax=Plasmodium vinckei petteri TaxID=138298 RepID=A0A6V7TF01_PLAVN|nr:calcium/calmodulin-dependent protein kinase, putative [Plasmodium vinckei petteri]